MAGDKDAVMQQWAGLVHQVDTGQIRGTSQLREGRDSIVAI